MTLTTADIAAEAERMGRAVSQEYVRRLCANGVIPATRGAKRGRGYDWLVSEEDALEWLEKYVNQVKESRK